VPLSGSIPELPHVAKLKNEMAANFAAWPSKRVAKLKNEMAANFAAWPSKRVFRDPMPFDKLTKAAGWKSCDPPHDFKMRAPAPLENFARTHKKSFAT
jgi:hypothetical protein